MVAYLEPLSVKCANEMPLRGISECNNADHGVSLTTGLFMIQPRVAIA